MTDSLKRISVLYFGLVYLGYVLTVFVPGFRTGVFAAALLVGIVIEIGLGIIKSDKPSDFISVMNICVLGYLFYNFISFIWIIKNGYPISIYVEEFSNSVLPVVFYFVAVICFEKGFDAVYKSFLFSYGVFSLLCIIFYAWAPQFYCDFLFNMSFISKADASTCHVRMEGFTGSTCVSYLGVAAMVVAAKYMYEKFAEKKFKEFSLYSFLFVYFLAVVFLANGRAGMVAAILVIVYINFLVFYCFKFAPKKYLYIELGVIVLLILVMCALMPGVVAKIWARLVSLPGAVGQRSEQWISAINNMHGQWFGNGLGANGHKAINIEGAHAIPDGGIVKLYCEEGALGFSLFVYIMLVTFRNGIKNLKATFAELGIIGTALMMSIGSNIIAFQLCVPIFWYAVGVVEAGRKKCE